MTLPILTVLLDDGTGTFPFDITSKVMSLDGYEVARGRSDWIGSVTAGELNLTLNNSDGRFTPGSTILGSPSPIKVDQRIRVVEAPGGGLGGFGLGGFGLGPFGGGADRFTGYVKSWPVSWPAVVSTFATVQVTATDAQSRAERRTLRSMLEEETLLRSPEAYYTLGEPEGSTSAGDTSGNGNNALVVAGAGTVVAFGAGTGPGADGLPAAQFASLGQHLTTSLTLSGAALSVGVWVVPPPGANAVLVTGLAPGGATAFSLTVEGATWSGSTGMVSGPSIDDGHTHFLMPVFDGGTTTLYVDGLSVGSAASTVGPIDTIVVGLSGAGLMTLSHVSFFTSALSAADVSAIYNAGSGASETADVRIARLAGYAGIPVGTMDASTTIVPAQATSGQSAQDAIQEAADADLGLVFVDGSGALAFHNRDHVTTKTVPDLILDSQYVTSDVQPVTDDQQIVNYFEVTAAGTGATTVARDVNSEATHGRYPVSETYLVTTDAEALSRATWTVSKFAEPTTRYGTLTINLYKMTDAMAASVVAALDLNCWLRVTSMASQNPGGSVADVVVQGWRTAATGESWEIACNVVARSLYQAALWDDAGSLWDSAVWSV